MSRSTAAFTEASERVLPPGLNLLLDQLGNALAEGNVFCAQMVEANERGDAPALREASACLVKAINVDPKALARRINGEVAP